jgi:hypothetical protein
VGTVALLKQLIQLPWMLLQAMHWFDEKYEVLKQERAIDEEEQVAQKLLTWVQLRQLLLNR